MKKKVLDARSLRIKQRYQDNYRGANQEVKMRANEQKHVEDLAVQAEEAAVRNGLGTVYKLMKIFSGKYHSTKKKEHICQG